MGGVSAFGVFLEVSIVKIETYIFCRVRTQGSPRAPLHLHAMSTYFYVK